ncbi:MAG: MerR family transcriptional regulator, partial [Candidatus Eremiobacteraeota bacterium]|nr:MerR family transcriptional regulator [Candidatus Eremiobacteraeota bacterium]
MSGAFPIAAVAKLTGLSVDTLRAWERRYGAVTPRRDAGGVRRYNEEDVERLRLLRSATSMGNAIRHVAKLHDDQVRALVQGTTEASPDATGPIVERIVQSIRRYDAWHAEELLTRAAMLLDTQRFVIGVL